MQPNEVPTGRRIVPCSDLPFFLGSMDRLVAIRRRRRPRRQRSRPATGVCDIASRNSTAPPIPTTGNFCDGRNDDEVERQIAMPFQTTPARTSPTSPNSSSDPLAAPRMSGSRDGAISSWRTWSNVHTDGIVRWTEKNSGNT